MCRTHRVVCRGSPRCWAARRFLPKNLAIIGYARSKLNVKDLRATTAEHLKGATDEVKRFLDLLSYLPGAYDAAEGFQVALLASSCERRALGLDVCCRRAWVR